MKSGQTPDSYQLSPIREAPLLCEWPRREKKLLCLGNIPEIWVKSPRKLDNYCAAGRLVTVKTGLVELRMLMRQKTTLLVENWEPEYNYQLVYSSLPCPGGAREMQHMARLDYVAPGGIQ